MSDKKVLRKKYLNERRKINKKCLIEKSLIIQKRFLESSLYKECNKLCIYMDFNNEVKTDLILEQALFDGKDVYVPKINNDIIQFYRIDRNTTFYVNKFKIKEPEQKFEIFRNDDFPNVFIVPGVAFSKYGYRIGYGGGYYDKWIEKNPNNIYIGFAYDFQVIDDFGPEEYDKKVNYIITESYCLSVEF